MRRRWGSEPPEDDTSIGARMLRLRDPETGAALPDERLLPHIGMICELTLISCAHLLQSRMPADACGSPVALATTSMPGTQALGPGAMAIMLLRSHLSFAAVFAGHDTSGHTMAWTLCVSASCMLKPLLHIARQT